ncbi:MAG: DUF3343 domain-containing protein [Oscillospiraceae bacterium]|nr:DUF3343 domain-containing protein [Oscillospiraceae bacterium]
MEQYVATFHTHLAALRSCNALKKAGVDGTCLAPVPRRLSSSCGTCVFYGAEDAMLACMDADLEAVYRREEASFALVHQGDD